MKNPLDDASIRKTAKHLESSDRVLAVLMKEHGPCTIVPVLDNPFHTLALKECQDSSTNEEKGPIFYLDLPGRNERTGLIGP